MTIVIKNLDRVLRELDGKEAAVLLNVRRALLQSGNYVKKSMTDSMQKTAKTGRLYKRGGVTHRASAPGEAPAVDTGRLVGSINIDFQPTKYYVDSGVLPVEIDYARHLEYGTRKMEPRPFVAPARAKAKPVAEDNMGKAVSRGVKNG